MVVLEYLKTNGRNIAQTARVFGIQRPVVYDLLKKNKEGDLKNRQKISKHQPNKTSTETEKPLRLKKDSPKTKGLSRYLKKIKVFLFLQKQSGLS